MSRTIERIYFSVYEEMPKDTQEITDAYYSLFELVEKYFGDRSGEHEDFYRRIHDLTSAERDAGVWQGHRERHEPCRRACDKIAKMELLH